MNGGRRPKQFPPQDKEGSRHENSTAPRDPNSCVGCLFDMLLAVCTRAGHNRCFHWTASSPASIWLNVLNQSDREVSWTFPAKLDRGLVSSHPVLESALDLRRPTEAGQVAIGPGADSRSSNIAYLRPTLVVGKDSGQDHGLRLTLQPRLPRSMPVILRRLLLHRLLPTPNEKQR
jgi:hypothetical protein